MTIRTCSTCGTTKELNHNNFAPNKRCTNGLTRECRICCNSRRTKWANVNRVRTIEKSRYYEFIREMRNYGTTTAWYSDVLIEQKGLCSMCGHLSHHHGTIQRLQVDHNHECCDLHTKSCGKCLRGLLCADCNINLSYLEKFLSDYYVMPVAAKPGTWLEKALQYLMKWQGIHKTQTQEVSKC